MNVPFAETPLPTELAVVGESKEDPSLLLLLGEDGHYYAYSLGDGATRSVEPDDTWDVEISLESDLFT